MLRKNKKTLLRIFSTLLILVWIFSGWPRVGNFPPEIQKVYADSQNFTGTIDWQAPAGVTTVTVSATGGGAAGSPGGALKRPGGGGGAGAFTKGTIDVTPGEWYTVTVGTAVSSGDGNLSQIAGNTLTVTANAGVTTLDNTGGAGGAASTGGNIIASYKGGNGGTSVNTNDYGGSGGGEAGSLTSEGNAGTNANSSTGTAGGTGTAGADGGRGGDNGGANVTGGGTPGGGGGGAGGSSNVVGGGGRGEVLLEWTASVAPTITLSAANPVADTTATLNGNVTATGGNNPTVTMYWGDNDGGTTEGNWDNSSAPTSPGQPQGVAAFYKNSTSLPTGTTIYFSAKATNAGGTDWPPASLSFLTKPAAPTNVAATDGTYTNKVTITWTKSTGATDYHVWRDSTDLGAAGDVATFDDTGADAPTITAGSAVATDGTYADKVALSLSGASTTNGTTHTYKVVASNATGNSADSSTNTGYRGVGSLTYQWQRSAADSDASYSDISGATTASYDDTGAPANGDGRYFKCVLNATGATQQTSTVDRGYRNTGSLSVDIVDSGGTPVGSPLVTFSSKTFEWTGQTSTGTLGVSAQKIRLTNTTGNGSWNLTVGATSGASALWQGGTYSYDYNDSAANGRLRVDPSGGTVTPEGGCGAASPSKGSAAYFDAGNSITLLTSTTSFGCYWDFTGVALTQDIPAQQQADSYSIGMTLTAS